MGVVISGGRYVPNPQPDPGRLEAATDEAIAACGGSARDAIMKALIVTNEFLEAECVR